MTIHLFSERSDLPRKWQIAMTRIHRRELARWLHQLAILQKSGVDAVRSLEILSQQEPNVRLKLATQAVLHRVMAYGEQISSACALYPRIFTPSVLMFLSTGEAAGDIAGRAEQAARLLEREDETHQKVVSQLTSPLFTMVMCILLTFAVIKGVFPRLMDLYANLNAKLPLITQIVVVVVNIINHPLTIAGLIAAIVLLVKFKESLKQSLAAWALKTPAGPMMGKVLAISFCDALGHMYRDGVPLTVSMEILHQTTPMRAHAARLEKVLTHFRNSGDLATSIKEIPYFPKVVEEMLVVGQESGRLAPVLLSTARLLDDSVQDMVNGVLAVIEPFSVAFVGGIMCFFMLGLFLPIYELLKMVGR